MDVEAVRGEAAPRGRSIAPATGWARPEAGPVEVGLDHGRRAALDHAVGEDLGRDGRRRALANSAAQPNQLIDLLGAALVVGLEREQ
jgi:hypothetical protein